MRLRRHARPPLDEPVAQIRAAAARCGGPRHTVRMYSQRVPGGAPARLERSLHSLEAGALETIAGLLRAGEVPRSLPAAEVLGVGLPCTHLSAPPRGSAPRFRSRRTGPRDARRRAARRGARRTGRRGRTQWNTALENTASTGSASCSSVSSAWCTSARSPSASRARATIEGAASTAITRPRGRRSASRAVTRPLPQPASNTVSSPSSASRSSTCSAHATCGPETRS